MVSLASPPVTLVNAQNDGVNIDVRRKWDEHVEKTLNDLTSELQTLQINNAVAGDAAAEDENVKVEPVRDLSDADERCKLNERGLENGYPTEQQDGGRPGKYMRCSPQTADIASVPSLSPSVATATLPAQFGQATTTVTDLRSPHITNIAVPYAKHFNLPWPQHQQQQQQIPGHCGLGCQYNFPCVQQNFNSAVRSRDRTTDTYQPLIYPNIVPDDRYFDRTNATTSLLPTVQPQNDLPILSPVDVSLVLDETFEPSDTFPRSSDTGLRPLIGPTEGLMWNVPQTTALLDQSPRFGKCNPFLGVQQPGPIFGSSNCCSDVSACDLWMGMLSSTVPVNAVRPNLETDGTDSTPKVVVDGPVYLSPSHEYIIDNSPSSTVVYRQPAQTSPSASDHSHSIYDSASSCGNPASAPGAGGFWDFPSDFYGDVVSGFEKTLVNTGKCSSDSCSASSASPGDADSCSRESSPSSGSHISDGMVSTQPTSVEDLLLNNTDASIDPFGSSAGQHADPTTTFRDAQGQRLSTEKRSLADNDAHLLKQNDDGDTMLHSALIHGDAENAMTLICRCEQIGLLEHIIRIRNTMQQTPLCLAVITNQPEIVQKLLDAGSDPCTQIITDRGQQIPWKREQPLHFAASKGVQWLDTLRVLLSWSRHNDIDVFNSEGRTALHCAVESHGRGTTTVPIDATHTILMLVENGANLNKQDGQCDKSPLHYAIEKRDVELVRLLLELAGTPAASATARRGRRCASLVADMLSTRTGTGNAALHLAVCVRHMVPREKRRLVQLLLSRGADPSGRNSEGRLPREMTNDPEIVELLKGRPGRGH